MYAHQTMKELLTQVSQYYYENRLHELSDEAILSYGRLRRIPIVGKRHDIINRLYKYIYRRECPEIINTVCYDLEFTGLPEWNRSGVPDQEIIEIGAFHPATEQSFSCLVKPDLYKISDEASALTLLNHDILQKEGVVIREALRRFYMWIEKIALKAPPVEIPLDTMTSSSRHLPPDDVCKFSLKSDLSDTVANPKDTLLISHGGLMNDIKMLKYYSSAFNVDIPTCISFADSVKLIKESTIQKSEKLTTLKLDSLANELCIPRADQSHRALSDALMTWKVLSRTLSVFGNNALTPMQEITKKHYQWKKL